jgi:Flp pilus assembly pilin Flp
MKNENAHMVEYGVLLTVTLLMSLLFYYFRYDRGILIFLAGVASFSYALWGIVHHALEDRLTKLIALEYTLFAALVFLLLFTVLTFK